MEAVKFLALDFGRNACGDAQNFKIHFVERPDLLALSRLFYVNFAVQSELEWVDFLGKAVVPLIQAGLDFEFVNLMNQQFKTFKGESRCVILVDEIMRTEELGVDFAERVRSKVCTLLEDRLCNAVLFSTLDAKFMNKENTASRRHVRAVTTLPLLTLTESTKFLHDEIGAVFVDGGGNQIDNRDTVVRQLACASGGHPRSIEYIIRYCTDHTGSVTTK